MREWRNWQTRTFEGRVVTPYGFKSRLSHQEKRPFSNGLFSIQSEGLACNLTAGEYVIAEGVWHHASACILLRIDYIQHFVLIPYRRQAADFIHAFAVILRVAFLYYEHISSVHNGFQLWTLDFFMLKSLFSFLDMYRSRFFCSFLFCLGKAVMPSDIVRQHPFGFQQCDYVFCHRRRFRYIPQSGSKS